MASKRNASASMHMLYLVLDEYSRQLYACNQCGGAANYSDKHCSSCGHFVERDNERKAKALNDHLDVIIDAAKRNDIEKLNELGMPRILTEEEQRQRKRERDTFVFPSTGIYVYHHPYEGYKIGQAENVTRRMSKHLCSAPSAELLHVIETSDLDWCEQFLHTRFRHCRIHNNHEYFNLTRDDLIWLFSIKVLEPPRSLDAQLSLLDLL